MMVEVGRPTIGDRESELERLRFALVAAGIGVWRWDPVADAAWWSAEVAAHFGVSDLAGRSFADLVDLIHPLDRDAVVRAFETGLASGGEFAAEFRVERSDATFAWLLGRGRVERDQQGRPRLVHGIVADVSRRKAVEETLRLNEERYRALVFASADVVWTMDAEGRPQAEEQLAGLADRTWVAFTGQSEHDLRQTGWLAVVQPDDRARVSRIWKDALAEGGRFDAEYRVRRQDGVERVLADRGVPIRDGSGRIVQWIGACTDVTERRAADAERERLLAAVAAERALLTAVLNQLPAGVVIAEAPSGRTILNNRQAPVILGYPAVEAGGLDEYAGYTAVHHDGTSYAAGEYPIVRAIAQGETVQDEELQFRRGDGRPGTLAVSAAPVRDPSGATVAGVAVYFDVTERKREEERQRFLATASAALAAAPDYEAAVQELARLIVPAIADACVVDVLEPSGVLVPLVIAASPETQAVLDELRTRYPAARERPAGVARVLATGEPSFVPAIGDDRRAEVAVDEEHLRLLRALGTRSNITVAMVARGEILGALTMKRIQSDQPYGAADLAFAEELARRAALALDNARLLREARAAVRLRDEFLSSASHDLKNPLTTIQGRVQLLRRRALRGEPLDAASTAVAHGLDEIAAAAGKLGELIDELRDVSSLQIGRPLTLRRRSVDLVALTREEVAQAQRTAPLHRLRFEDGLPLLVVAVDPGRLRRVIDNLLANAIKFSPDGGEITVTVGAEGRRDGGTERRRDGEGEWAVLMVRDEGVGIPAADVPHLFERFFRASNVAGRIAGTGIGLAGARQIVAQHGGTIAVASEEGRGSVFTVRLPTAVGRFGTAATDVDDDARSSTAAPSPTGERS